MATKEEQARIAAERLAGEKSELATKEALARKEADQHAADAKKQFAWNYFTHGVAEYEAGAWKRALPNWVDALYDLSAGGSPAKRLSPSVD